MVRIASQHHEGHPLPYDTAYRPRCAWPEEAAVQWGSGRSFVRYGAPASASPAFFEVFVADAQAVMFRGEAPSLDAAEAAAWTKFERYRACGTHDWQRKFDEYSSVGKCTRCGASGSRVFEAKERPEPVEGPLTPRDLDRIGAGFLKRGHSPGLGEEWERGVDPWRVAVALKAQRLDFAFPDERLEGEAYDHACEELVGAYWHTQRAWYVEYAKTLPPPGHYEPGFMNAMVVGCLDDLATQWSRHQTAAPAPNPL